MSKFTELVQIYQTDRQFYHGYEQAGFEFSQLLTEAVKQYYQIPEENFFFIGGEDQQKTVSSLAEALLMDEKGFWHVRYGINLPYTDALSQGQGFLLIVEILFKKLNGKFIIRLPEEEDFFIHLEESETDFSSFLHYLHDYLCRFLENRFERFLNGEQTERSAIGFRIHEKE